MTDIDVVIYPVLDIKNERLPYATIYIGGHENGTLNHKIGAVGAAWINGPGNHGRSEVNEPVYQMRKLERLGTFGGVVGSNASQQQALNPITTTASTMLTTSTQNKALRYNISLAWVERLFETQHQSLTKLIIGVQIFSEVKVNGAFCGAHACGWGAIHVIDLCQAIHNAYTSGAPTAVLECILSDTGPSAPGTRGRVKFIAPTTGTIASIHMRNLSPTSTPNRVLDVEIEELRQYHVECMKVCQQLPPISPQIYAMQLPPFTTCGGELKLPACAFILDPFGLSLDEDFFCAALEAALRRMFVIDPIIHTLPRDDLFSMYTNGRLGLSLDEDGAILADVALFFPHTCQYLFDMVMSTNGVSLEDGDEFSCNLAATHCGDCEDFGRWAVMTLATLLTGHWTHQAIRRLQAVRARYITTLALKGVSAYQQTSAFMTLSNTRCAAHDCCDLVPINMMRKMLASDAAKTSIDRIYESRVISGLIDPTAPLPPTIVIVDGTGHFYQFPRHTDPYLNTSSHVRIAIVNGVKAALNITDVTVRTVDRGDAHSAFYKFATTSLVHDTLLTDPKWPIPLVHFVTHDARHYGVPHEDYLLGNCLAIAAPTPSTKQLTSMRDACRYITPPTQLIPPRRDSTIYEECVKCLVQCVQPQPSSSSLSLYHSSCLPLFVPLWCFGSNTPNTLSKYGVEVVAAHPEHIADGVAMAMLLVRLKPRPFSF